MSTVTELISAVCAVVAALVSLATLVTVFVAAEQMLSRRQIYHLGLSRNSLGPWEQKVLSRSLFARFQLRVSTPTISVPKLVANNWEPRLTHTLGFVPDAKAKRAVPVDPEKHPNTSEAELADSSWVNFLQALGINPGCTDFFEMQAQPELVNGIVPMRWKGKDLVGICSLLGFQVGAETNPKPNRPMPLPLQWSGPLGWLQFRTSSDGCVAEFRPRARAKNKISKELHTFYKNFTTPPVCLVSRLWYSVGALPTNSPREVIFLAGTDKKEMKSHENDVMGSGGKMFDELMEADLEPGEIKKKIWGGRAKQPEAVRPEDVRGHVSQLNPLKSKNEDKVRAPQQKARVMTPCPGLISIIAEGALIDSRGLTYNVCHEYHSKFMDDDEVDEATHPHKLGYFRVDLKLLRLFKRAILQIRPDGFYFISSVQLHLGLQDVWEHVDPRTQFIFPDDQLTAYFDKDAKKPNEEFYRAMRLCNELQAYRKEGGEVFHSVEDMEVLSRAHSSIRGTLTDEGLELVWALLASPALFADLLKRFGEVDPSSALRSTVKVCPKTTGARGVNRRRIDCTSIHCPGVAQLPGVVGVYDVPELDLPAETYEYQSPQVLAAFLDVLLTFLWLGTVWPSNVGMYDTTIPQSVTMC